MYDLKYQGQLAAIYIYISKESKEPFFNCRFYEISFNYRVWFWAQDTLPFKFSDCFVHVYHNKWRILQILHYEVSEMKAFATRTLKQIDKSRSGWIFKLCSWWNDRLVIKTELCLYLHRPTGYGKIHSNGSFLHGVQESGVYMQMPSLSFYVGRSRRRNRIVLFGECRSSTFQGHFG
jgi:hypothetical protein